MLFNCDLNNNSFCLSISDNRYDYLCKNFNAVGLKSPTLYRGIRWGNGTNRGCVIGHLSIIMMARALDLPYVFVYEDDAYPRYDVISMFKYLKPYIPSDCGLLKIGSSSLRGDYNPINKYIFQSTNGTAFGSHAYLIRKELYDSFIIALETYNVPDIAMSNKNYMSEKFHSYGLYINCMLFIQKNIDSDNIISSKGGQQYWYMDPDSLLGKTSGIPPSGFKDKLFDNQPNYIKQLCVVRNENWKKKKKTAIIENDIIQTKEESGKLYLISKNCWKIIWNSGKYEEYLIFDEEKENTKFYTIKEKL